MKDLMNVIDVKRAISPVSVSDNTAQVGQVVDRKGYDSATYIIATGSIADADATFTVLLEESDASGSGHYSRSCTRCSRSDSRPKRFQSQRLSPTASEHPRRPK